MPIKFNCHKCDANLRVPEQHIGKKARCPKCDEKCIVPETSQRQSSNSGLGGNFEDIGQFLEEPIGLPAVPVAPPLAVPAPVMAAPVATGGPLPSSIPVASSPYAAPKRTARSAPAISGNVMQPLYDARNMIKLFGWVMFIGGILQCVTIIYAIVGWIPLILGWQIKSAGEALTIGFETGDKAQLRLAAEKLATYFRIMGILTIIWLAIMGLVLVLAVVALIVGLVANV